MQASILETRTVINRNGRNAGCNAAFTPSRNQGDKSSSQSRIMTEMSDLVKSSTRRNAMGSGSKAGRPQLRHSTFNWSEKNKYELKKLQNGGMKHYMTKIMM